VFGRFGTSLFGATEFLRRIFYKTRRVACVGDIATHPGQIITSGQDGTVFAGGAVIAVNGAIFQCATHGPSTITSIIKKTYINGKLIVTEGAVSSCGATMKPIDRKVYAG
jgi:uncharacterized Zn-binding protein involved in type VI secretion